MRWLDGIHNSMDMSLGGSRSWRWTGNLVCSPWVAKESDMAVPTELNLYSVQLSVQSLTKHVLTGHCRFHHVALASPGNF